MRTKNHERTLQPQSSCTLNPRRNASAINETTTTDNKYRRGTPCTCDRRCADSRTVRLPLMRRRTTSATRHVERSFDDGWSFRTTRTTRNGGKDAIHRW